MSAAITNDSDLALTNNSDLAFLYLKDNNQLEKVCHYVVRSAKSWPKDEMLHIQFVDQTKIIIMMLINIMLTK